MPGVRQGRSERIAVPSAPTTRRELRALAAISAPLAAAYLAETAMSFTDIVIVGQLGSVELAAVGLTANLLFGLLFVSMGVVSIVGVMVAQAQGAARPAEAGGALRDGLWVAFATSVPATALGWYIAPLLRVLGQEEAVILHAEAYGRAVVWCFLPYMWFTVLRNFVTALARPASVMVISLAAVGLNLLANYALVFGKFGLPALGVRGAGYGTTLVCWAMLAALAVHVLAAPAFRPYLPQARRLRPDFRIVREILRLGWPVAGISAVESSLFSAVSILMGLFGAAVLAATQIAFSVLTVIFMIPFAIGQAGTIRVAHGVGAGSPAAARRAGMLALLLGAAYMLATAVALWLFPEAIARVYLDTADPLADQVLAHAVLFLAIGALFQVADGTQMIAAGVLRGLSDTRGPFLIGVVGYWVVGLGSGYLLAFPLGFGPVGVWWGLALGLAVAALLLTRRFDRRSRARPPAALAPALPG